MCALVEAIGASKAAAEVKLASASSRVCAGPGESSVEEVGCSAKRVALMEEKTIASLALESRSRSGSSSDESTTMSSRSSN